MRKSIVICCLALVVVGILRTDKTPQETVNVYGWYGIIGNEILKDFEKETGIKVIYDVYDNNDTLEAKLLATNSGYDVVFPSFIPYAARQCAMGIYAKLNEDLIPNLKNIQGAITEKFKIAGGDITRLVPMFWGTIGIAYDEEAVRTIFPEAKEVTYDMLLKPENIKKLSQYGVSFPEEYIDIFPQTAVFLKLMDDDSIKTAEKIKEYVKHFKEVRKYIKKFSSTTLIKDLLSGEVIVAIGCSDNAWRAIQSAKKVNKKIKYIIPKGYATLWIDCMGIPAKAPHKENANKFVNYLLRPEVAAKLTNNTGILVNIPDAYKYFEKEFINDTQVCPQDRELVSGMIMGTPSRNAEDVKTDRMATRAWAQIKMNDFNYLGE
ncbi:MAG: extracellular solute-binding protein [Alphaproteobacteria bacterium]|nr:extracellular solute-binding protein [Alphaproteobacteria bacterium]